MRPRFTLLAKIYLSTAGAATVVFAGAGWFFERQASRALHDGVGQEVRASLGTIDASLESRVEHLLTASALLASMSDVRSAFGTRDRATIGDTAGEMWTRASAGHADAVNAAFTVAGPGGAILASVGGQAPSALQTGRQLSASILEPARKAFPKQSTAFAVWDGSVWQVVATPVYVDSGTRAAGLLSILLAAYPLTDATLRELKERTGGSDLLLRVGGQTVLATLSADAARQVVSHPEHFAIRPTVLRDGAGQALAELWAVRSFAAAEDRITTLRNTMVIAWAVAMTLGLALSYLLARRIVRPIRAMNQAAQQVSREDYSARVPEGSADELGVLARTFNRMSASIEQTRAEQIRSGQIAAVGRLAASIAHDLRNPLAAIVGGSEMLVEFDLPPDQAKQTAVHIHKAALNMDHLLSEIGQVARAGSVPRVRCSVRELVDGAVEAQEAKAEAKNVGIRETVEPDLSVTCEKSRVERVLINLIANAIDVLKEGGEISIHGSRNGDGINIDVSDNGPGVPAEIKDRLFQPFVTAGKRNGLGLGLALARQTMLDHNGDLELVPSDKGACFRLRLPCA
ncbi:MAG TPA: HAMP domain-containing sensor histidine kinase [Bryobacteraceae bacterium]|nr:HAMP domain-containing sensor histidine kinase [Bryobacteraceae bacterium]